MTVTTCAPGGSTRKLKRSESTAMSECLGMLFPIFVSFWETNPRTLQHCKFTLLRLYCTRRLKVVYDLQSDHHGLGEHTACISRTTSVYCSSFPCMKRKGAHFVASKLMRESTCRRQNDIQEVIRLDEVKPKLQSSHRLSIATVNQI